MISLGMLVLSILATGELTDDLPARLADEFEPTVASETPLEESAIPESLALAEPRIAGGDVELSIGPAGGYLRARHSDRGTWFGGVQGRLHFLRYLGAEASITFHSNRYDHGDIHVTQYPVQVSALIYPFPDWEFRPYAVGGFGWYYTRITFTGTLTAISNETDHVFGSHLGAGGELRVSPKTSLDADVRYIWLYSSNTDIKASNFNYWQITFGINFFF